MNRNFGKREIIKYPLKSFKQRGNNINTNINRRVYNISNFQNNKQKLINSKSLHKASISSDISEATNKDKINKLKEYLPYIPNKERQKAEDNFIHLIKSIINSENNEKLNALEKNVSVKNNENERYKPRGYGYYELIRKNPIIIRDLDQNVYSKILRDIENFENNNDYQKEKDVTKAKNKKDLSLYKKNNLTEVNIFPNNEFNYFQAKNKNSESQKNMNINKSNLKIQINDNNKEQINSDFYNNQVYLPAINHTSIKQKDYHKSDIFYLVNDSLSKEKTSEKYLFKPNYSPRKLENDKKTNINEVGWSPKLEKNKSRIGCSSVAFNIINPELKCLSPMKKEIDSLNKNNFEKAPLISDYIDMCKPGDIRLRKEYNDILNENKTVFHRKNYCASYSDLHHEYKDLVNNVF